MKRSLPLVAVVGLLLGSLCAGQLRAADGGIMGPKPGFRSYKWGDPPPKDAKKVEPAAANPDGNSYTIPSEKLVIGEAKLLFLHFDYFEGHLYAVSFATEPGGNNSETLLRGLRTSWSVPSSKDEINDEYSWRSDDPEFGVTVATYQNHPSDKYATVIILSRRIAGEAEAARDKKARGAKDDL